MYCSSCRSPLQAVLGQVSVTIPRQLLWSHGILAAALHPCLPALLGCAADRRCDTGGLGATRRPAAAVRAADAGHRGAADAGALSDCTGALCLGQQGCPACRAAVVGECKSTHWLNLLAHTRTLLTTAQGILQQAAVGSPGSAPGTPTAGGAAQQQQPDVRLVLPLMERVTTIFRQEQAGCLASRDCACLGMHLQLEVLCHSCSQLSSAQWQPEHLRASDQSNPPLAHLTQGGEGSS